MKRPFLPSGLPWRPVPGGGHESRLPDLCPAAGPSGRCASFCRHVTPRPRRAGAAFSPALSMSSAPAPGPLLNSPRPSPGSEQHFPFNLSEADPEAGPPLCTQQEKLRGGHRANTVDRVPALGPGPHNKPSSSLHLASGTFQPHLPKDSRTLLMPFLLPQCCSLLCSQAASCRKHSQTMTPNSNTDPAPGLAGPIEPSVRPVRRSHCS